MAPPDLGGFHGDSFGTMLSSHGGVLIKMKTSQCMPWNR